MATTVELRVNNVAVFEGESGDMTLALNVGDVVTLWVVAESGVETLIEEKTASLNIFQLRQN